VGAGHSLVRQG